MEQISHSLGIWKGVMTLQVTGGKNLEDEWVYIVFRWQKKDKGKHKNNKYMCFKLFSYEKLKALAALG